jgi:hypothetical protein
LFLATGFFAVGFFFTAMVFPFPHRQDFNRLTDSNKPPLGPPSCGYKRIEVGTRTDGLLDPIPDPTARHWAERRLGEMMADQPKEDQPRSDRGLFENPRMTLAQAGIDKNLAHRAPKGEGFSLSAAA